MKISLGLIPEELGRLLKMNVTYYTSTYHRELTMPYFQRIEEYKIKAWSMFETVQIARSDTPV